MAFGERRDHAGIEMFVRRHGAWHYLATTRWTHDCDEAKAELLKLHPYLASDDVRAFHKSADRPAHTMPAEVAA